jgi:hypothetical protein
MKITKGSHPAIVKLMQKTYPDYKGRKFYLEVKEGEIDCTSYWDEGSRTYYKFVRTDGKVFEAPINTAPWIQVKENRKIKLIPGLCCITESIFCGHLCGLTIMFCPEDMPKQLTTSEEGKTND